MWGTRSEHEEGSCSQSDTSFYQSVFAEHVTKSLSDFSGQNTQQVIALLKFMCYKNLFRILQIKFFIKETRSEHEEG